MLQVTQNNSFQTRQHRRMTSLDTVIPNTHLPPFEPDLPSHVPYRQLYHRFCFTFFLTASTVTAGLLTSVPVPVEPTPANPVISALTDSGL